MRTAGLLFSTLLFTAACGGDDTSTPDAPPPPPDASTVDASPPDASPPPDAPPPPDARNYDFSCMGNPPATTAPDPINFNGTVSDILLMSPIADMTVKVWPRGADPSMTTGELASATTDATGAFSMSVANPSMMPADTFVQFSKTNYSSTYIFPPDPVANDVSMLNGIGTNMLPLLYSFTTPAPSPTYSTTAGTAIVLVVDCAGDPIAGATVGLSPAPQAIGYLVGMAPSTNAPSTGDSGVALGYAVPVGTVTVTADYMGTALESHTFESYADSISVTIIHP